MNRLDQLAELSSIDMRIDENIRARRQAEAQLADDAAIVASQIALDETNRQAKEIRARIISLELEANGIGDKIKTVEANLYDGRTTSPKELSGMEQDAFMLKRRKSEVEDHILDAMAELETTEAAGAGRRAELDQVSSEKLTSTAHARAALEKLDLDASKLRRTREQLSAQISPGDMAVYENLRREKKGRALARIKGSSCEACGFSLPSGVASRARVGQELEFCSNCGRILIA